MATGLFRILGIVALAALPSFAAGVEPAGRAASEATAQAETAPSVVTGPAVEPPVAAPTAPDAATNPEPAEANPEQPAATSEGAEQPFPVIHRGEEGLPEPVRQTRRKLIEAARSGDMEQVRAVAAEQPEPPSTAFGDVGDPIDYLMSLASDVGGREILAILLEVLEAGHVHVDAGGAEEMYLWPYFAAYPLEALTPPQLVELFTLLASAEYEEMRSYGAYTFFRVGIGPDGSWHFFLAGD